ncbi:MAG: low affinity iron permease family protein [Thermomicrobiales bacterium]
MNSPRQDRFIDLWNALVQARRSGELQEQLPSLFQRFAAKAAREMGHSRTFIAAVAFVLVWLISGPLFGFSTGWQLVINTGTTIITFLMVFLIQNTQNRDSAALQVKVDELIRATEGAHNALLNLEALDDAELDRIQSRYRQLASVARQDMASGVADTSVVAVDFRDEMTEVELTSKAQEILQQRLTAGIEDAAHSAREIGGRLIHPQLGPDSPPVSSLKQLIAGNRRYIAGKPRHPHQTIDDRHRTFETQKPVAAILGCADSRVSPELLFDQGIGDLFTVRVGGNIVNSVVENSLEFAVLQFGVPLIVVLGHQDCGAVQTTISALTAGQDIEHHPNSLVQSIAPVARSAASRSGDPVENTVRDNVYLSVDRLRAAANLSQHVDAGDLQIVGAYYHLDTGEVEFLEE